MSDSSGSISGNEVPTQNRQRPPEPPFAYGLQPTLPEEAAYASVYRDDRDAGVAGGLAAAPRVDPSEGARVRHDIKADTERLREKFLAEVQAQAQSQNRPAGSLPTVNPEASALKERIDQRRKQYQSAADQLSAPVAANEAAEVRIRPPAAASNLREGFTSPGPVLKQQESLLTENRFTPTRVLQAEHTRQFKEGFRRWYEKERDAEERRERVAADNNDPLRTNNFATRDGAPATADQPAAPPDSIGNQLTNPHETDRLNKPRITFQQIDSADRDFSRYPDPNDYRISLSRRFSNVKRVKLIASEIPNTDQIIRDDPREALITRNRLYLRCGQVLNDANKHIYWIDEADGTQAGNYDCIVYDACITPGNYVAQSCQCNERTLASEIETKVSGINRFIDGRAHEFVVTIDEQTNIVSVLSIQSNELGVNPIDTSAGTNVITITQLQHPFEVGDYVTISGATSVGGISADTLNATHQIIAVTDDTYDIRVNTIATQTVGGGGGNVLAGQNRPFMLLASNVDTPFSSVLGFPQQDSAEQIATPIEFIDCEAPDLAVDPTTPTECGTINARICATNHCLTVGDEILILDTDTIPNINGLQTVTNVISSDKFEIGKKVKVVNNQTVTTQTVLGSIKRSLDTEVSQITELTVAQQGFICTECPHNLSTIVEDNTVWLGNLIGGLTETLQDLNGIHTVNSVLAPDKFTITDGIIFGGTDTGNAFVVKTSSTQLVPITEIIPANNGRFCPPFISDPCCAAELSRIFTGSNVPQCVLFRNTDTDPDINGVVYRDVDTVGLCDELTVTAALDLPTQSFTTTQRGFLIGVYIRLGNGLAGSTGRLIIYDGGTAIGISPVTALDNSLTRGTYFCISPTVNVDCPSGLEVLAGTVLSWQVADVKDTPIFLMCSNGGTYEFCTFMSPGIQEIDYYSQTTGCFDLKSRNCNGVNTFPGICEVNAQLANQEFIRSADCELRCIIDATIASNGEWITDKPHNLSENNSFYARLKTNPNTVNTTTVPYVEPNVLGIQTVQTIFGSTSLDTTLAIETTTYSSSPIAGNICIIRTNDLAPTPIQNIYPATTGYFGKDVNLCAGTSCRLCPGDMVFVRPVLRLNDNGSIINYSNYPYLHGTSPFNALNTPDPFDSLYRAPGGFFGCYEVNQVFQDISPFCTDIIDFKIKSVIGDPNDDWLTILGIDTTFICEPGGCESALQSPAADAGLPQFNVYEPRHMRAVGHVVRFEQYDQVYAKPYGSAYWIINGLVGVFPEASTFGIDLPIIEVIDDDHYTVQTNYPREVGFDVTWPQVFIISVSPPNKLIRNPSFYLDSADLGECAKLVTNTSFDGMNGIFNVAQIDPNLTVNEVPGQGAIYQIAISRLSSMGRVMAPCPTQSAPRATWTNVNFTLTDAAASYTFTLVDAVGGGLLIPLPAGDPLTAEDVGLAIVTGINNHGLFVATNPPFFGDTCIINIVATVPGPAIAGATIGTLGAIAYTAGAGGASPPPTLSIIDPGSAGYTSIPVRDNGLHVRTKTPHGLDNGCLVYILLPFSLDSLELSIELNVVTNCNYVEYPFSESVYPRNIYEAKFPGPAPGFPGFGPSPQILRALHNSVGTVTVTSDTSFKIFNVGVVSGLIESIEEDPVVITCGDLYYHKICQDFQPFKRFFDHSFCGMIESASHGVQNDYGSIYIGKTNVTADINGCLPTKCLVEDTFERYCNPDYWGYNWYYPNSFANQSELITKPAISRGGTLGPGSMGIFALDTTTKNATIQVLPNDFILAWAMFEDTPSTTFGYASGCMFSWSRGTNFNRDPSFGESGYFVAWVSAGHASYSPPLPNFHLHLIRYDAGVGTVLASAIPTGSLTQLWGINFRVEVESDRIRVFHSETPVRGAYPVENSVDDAGDIPLIDVVDTTYRNGSFGFASTEDGIAGWNYVKLLSAGSTNNVTVLDENFLGWIGESDVTVVDGVSYEGIITGNTKPDNNGYAGEFVFAADDIKIELNVTDISQQNNGIIFADNEFQGGECLYFLNDTNLNEGTSQALAETIRVVSTENLSPQKFQLTTPITNFGGLLNKNIPNIGSDIFLFADPTLNPQIFVVPNLVFQIDVTVVGAGGGGAVFGTDQGGRGGLVQGTLEVTPGQVFFVYVGGGGKTTSQRIAGGGFGIFSNSDGGVNGGGLGAHLCGGGGGASDIRFGGTSLLDRIIVAGGGGGGGFTGIFVNTPLPGGAGGGTTGNAGSGTTAGGGGTQLVGGVGGSGAGSTAPGNSGILGSGGDGGTPLGAPNYCDGVNSCGGGGGGGGYYGGGGGASGAYDPFWQGVPKGGGGGGSSLVPVGMSSIIGGGSPSNTDGFVIISIPSEQCITTPGIYPIDIPNDVIAIELEVAGAGGGPGAANVGGPGGLAGGILSINAADSIQLLVGGAGINTAGGFNNGGDGGAGGLATPGGGGGGASAVFLNGTNLDDRVIVAGGGGGGSGTLVGQPAQTGGAGGGLVGQNGSVAVGFNIPTGGTQNGPGTNAPGGDSSGEPVEDQGGSSISAFGLGQGCGGGGGGWFGGGAGIASGTVCSGAGGSGHLSPVLISDGTLTNSFNETGNGSPSATDGYVCFRLIRSSSVTLPTGHFIQLPSCADNFNTIELIERKTNGVFTSSLNHGFSPLSGNACEIMTSNIGDCIFFTDGVYGDTDVGKLKDVLGNARPFPTPAPVFSLTKFDTDIVINPEDLEGGGGFPLGGNHVDPVSTNDARFPGINGLGWIYATDCKINPIINIQRDSNGSLAPVKPGLTVGASIFIDSQHPTIPDLNGVFTVSYIDVGNGSFPAFFELANTELIDVDGPVADGNIFYFCSPPMVGNIDPCLPINEITANTCPTVLRVTGHGFTVGTTVSLYIIDSQTDPSINSVEGNTIVRDIINNVQVLDEDTLQLPLVDSSGNTLCDLEILNQTNLLVTPRGRFSKEFLSTNCGRAIIEPDPANNRTVVYSPYRPNLQTRLVIEIIQTIPSATGESTVVLNGSVPSHWTPGTTVNITGQVLGDPYIQGSYQIFNVLADRFDVIPTPEADAFSTGGTGGFVTGPATETIPGHGLMTGDQVMFRGATMTKPSLDGLSFEVTVIDSERFWIDFLVDEVLCNGTWCTNWVTADVKNHGLSDGDIVFLYGAQAVGGLIESKLNTVHGDKRKNIPTQEELDTRKIVRVIDGNTFQFLANKDCFPTARELGGGFEICLSARNHTIAEVMAGARNYGFASEQTNQTCMGDVRRFLNFSNLNYILMTSDRLTTDDVNPVLNTGPVDQVFAKIQLSGAPGSVMFNTFIGGERIFYEPIGRLDEIDIGFRRPDNRLFDFRGREHSFTLEIEEYQDRMRTANVSSRRGINDPGAIGQIGLVESAISRENPIQNLAGALQPSQFVEATGITKQATRGRN